MGIRGVFGYRICRALSEWVILPWADGIDPELSELFVKS